MKILALSAYHAPSHRRWVEGLAEYLPHHDFQIISQPPRHFPWRSRGNSLAWAFDDQIQNARADLIVATSMVDLAGLRGMVPHLSQIPTLVYYHENQFAYPTRDGKTHANLLVTNLYTALSAERVLFNSSYNRRSFLAGIETFLDRMPDQIPDGVAEKVAEKSSILPVPLGDDLGPGQRPENRSGPLRIAWNHRWEYDKAPERFFRAIFQLKEQFQFRLVVTGQQFREAPSIFESARRKLSDRIDQWGWIADRDAYHRALRQCDIVVSTAIHEFQGLAIQEAVLMGCRPLLPERLAYPDFFDRAYLYDSHIDDPERDTASLKEALKERLQAPAQTRQQPLPDLQGLRWKALGERYDREFQRLVDHHG